MQRCYVCKNVTGEHHLNNVVGHHLITFASRPDLDIPDNIIPLCVNHHSEFHSRGLGVMVVKYGMRSEMESRGFYYYRLTDKWRHN